MKNVRDILRQWLLDHHYDGLYNNEDDVVCSCGVDDLFSCLSSPTYCKPGVKVECNPKTCPDGGGCPFHIVVREAI